MRAKKTKAKRTGTVVQIRCKFYARWRTHGRDAYGPARETYDEADLDRLGRSPKRPAGHHPTLQEWAHWCMDASNERYGIYGRRIAPSTFATNESIRLNWIEGSKLGAMKLKSISRHDVALWAETVQQGRPGGESAHWVRRCLAFVSKLFTCAMDHQFISLNPAKGVQVAVPPERINRILSESESAAFFPPQDRTDAFICLAILTGGRRGELVAAQWSDIRDGHWIVKAHPNKGGHRMLPLSDAAMLVLDSLPKSSTFVFCTESGKPLSPRNITRDVKRRFADRGLPPETRLQDLRGTFATTLIRAGVDIKTVQNLARHSSAKTTMKAYLRSSDQIERGAVNNLGEKLSPTKKPRPGLAEGVSGE